MKFVSPVLKRLVYPALQRAAFLRYWARNGSLAVMTYHGVLPQGYVVTDRQLDGGWVTRESFRAHLRLLRSHYNLVSPEDVRQWCVAGSPLPPRAVLLTCDDGLANTVLEMLPILQVEKVTCLFFVTAESLSTSDAMLWYEELYLTLLAAPAGEWRGDFLGVPVQAALASDVRQRHRLWWDMVSTLSTCDAATRLGFAKAIRNHYGMPQAWERRFVEEYAARFRLLAENEIRQLLEGGMTIGSHTITHPKLSHMSADHCWAEISSSRSELEKRIGTPIWSIAYPFGGVDSVSGRELQMAERAGYDCAFTNFGGGFGPKSSRFGIPRLHVSLDMNLAEFEAHLCGLHESLRRCFGYIEQLPAEPAADRQPAGLPNA